MKKLLVRGSWFVVKIIILLLFVLLPTINYQLLTVHAADSTPSADIKAKLEELKKEIASKAAKLKQEVDRKLKDKAYVGKVKSKSDNALTLAADSGPKIVSLNQDTLFESQVKGKSKFSQKNISEEDYVAALGDSDETGVLIAKKVILMPTPKTEPKSYLWGKIISISDNLVTLKDKDLKNIAASLPPTPPVKLNDFVILTGNINKNDIFDAGFVFVIPQGGNLRPKKIATPSAQIVYPVPNGAGATPSGQKTSPIIKSTPTPKSTPKPTSR